MIDLNEQDQKMPTHVHLYDWENFVDGLLVLFIKMFSYAFMLIAMTFNFWIVLSMCLGMAMSEFIFSILKDRRIIHQITLY